MRLAVSRCVLDIIKGRMSFETLPYFVDWRQVTLMVASTLIRFEALNVPIPDSINLFMISAFVESVKCGEVEL